MLSVTQNSDEHRPVLIQAPVRALDPDGLAVVSAGTAAFGVGIVLCVIFQIPLANSDRSWYLWVAVIGTIIGLIGLATVLIQRRLHLHTKRPDSVEKALIDGDGVPDRE